MAIASLVILRNPRRLQSLLSSAALWEFRRDFYQILDHMEPLLNVATQRYVLASQPYDAPAIDDARRMLMRPEMAGLGCAYARRWSWHHETTKLLIIGEPESLPDFTHESETWNIYSQ
jgi:hypothetical protein